MALDTYAGDHSFIESMWPGDPTIQANEHAHKTPCDGCYYNHTHPGGAKPHTHPHVRSKSCSRGCEEER